MKDSILLEHESPRTAADTVIMVSPFSKATSHELRRLTVLETEETIILCGRVSSFYLKQMAQETVLAKANNRRIINRIEVTRG